MLGGCGRRLVREVKAERRRQLAQKQHNKVRCAINLALIIQEYAPSLMSCRDELSFNSVPVSIV